jgi:hypothetical protein
MEQGENEDGLFAIKLQAHLYIYIYIYISLIPSCNLQQRSSIAIPSYPLHIQALNYYFAPLHMRCGLFLQCPSLK